MCLAQLLTNWQSLRGLVTATCALSKIFLRICISIIVSIVISISAATNHHRYILMCFSWPLVFLAIFLERLAIPSLDHLYGLSQGRWDRMHYTYHTALIPISYRIPAYHIHTIWFWSMPEPFSIDRRNICIISPFYKEILFHTWPDIGLEAFPHGIQMARR